jgi:hypothetical protein
MRVLFGIVLGVALTVAAAFIADNAGTDSPATSGSGSAARAHRNMVNWDVVSDNMRVASERVRQTWDRISNKLAG